MPLPHPLTPPDPAAALARRALAEPANARLLAWGLRDFGEILHLQQALREGRQAGRIADTWLAGEHPTVITQGVRGAPVDLIGRAPYPLFPIDRGGQTTIHNPGQLVIYCIVKTHAGLTAQARLSRALLAATRDWLAAQTGVALAIEKGRPGLFAPDGRKAAAIGISIRGCVAMHGIAVNLCNDLSPWKSIVACGEPDTHPVTLSDLAARRISPPDLIPHLAAWLRQTWGYTDVLIDDFEKLQSFLGQKQTEKTEP